MHSLWDSALGTDVTDVFVTRQATEIIKEFTAARGTKPKLSKEPKAWIQEGYALARSQVYTFGNESGSREKPLALPAGYTENARRVARAQVAIAGIRMADLLNEKLR